MPEMQDYIEEQQIGGGSIAIDQKDPQTLRFFDPQSFSDNSILQEIRLETGALAAWTPTTMARITPYIAEEFPDAFKRADAAVRTVSPERTFWEKATILHKEAFRTNGRFPSRYSRHYYDLYKLAQSDVKRHALGNRGLLKSVVEFKMTFWRSNAARYDLCTPGTLRLMPPQDAIPLIEHDYASMRNMIFGDAPDFEEMMSGISRLQDEINESGVLRRLESHVCVAGKDTELQSFQRLYAAPPRGAERYRGQQRCGKEHSARSAALGIGSFLPGTNDRDGYQRRSF